MKVLYRAWYFLFCSLLLVFSLNTPAASLKSTVSDSLVTARIKSQLARGDNTKANAINVETSEGVVKLTGIVDSVPEAITVVKIAQSTNGVEDVNFLNLHLKEGVKIKRNVFLDNLMTAKIQGILEREKIMETENGNAGDKLIISTHNNEVVLSGKVKTQAEFDKIINLVNQVKGIKKVDSNITVTSNDKQKN